MARTRVQSRHRRRATIAAPAAQAAVSAIVQNHAPASGRMEPALASGAPHASQERSSQRIAIETSPAWALAVRAPMYWPTATRNDSGRRNFKDASSQIA